MNQQKCELTAVETEKVLHAIEILMQNPSFNGQERHEIESVAKLIREAQKHNRKITIGDFAKLMLLLKAAAKCCGWIKDCWEQLIDS